MQLDLEPLAEGGGSLSERVYRSLRGGIFSLAIQPGARIDKKAIAHQLGVSLFPVAEAVSRLSNEGMVEVVPQAGSYVTPFSMGEILESSFLRQALELAAVELVARTATDARITELRRNFKIQEVLAQEGDCDGFFRLDHEMHNLILGATGFPKLAALTETIWLQAERAWRLITETPGRALEALEEHRAIVSAIAAHDPERARLAMRRHLERVECDLRQLEEERADLFQPARPQGRHNS